MAAIKIETTFQDLPSDVLILMIQQMQESYFQKDEEAKKEKLRNAILSIKSNHSTYKVRLLSKFKTNEIKRLQTQLKVKTSQMMDYKEKNNELRKNYNSLVCLLESSELAHLIIKDEKKYD